MRIDRERYFRGIGELRTVCVGSEHALAYCDPQLVQAVAVTHRIIEVPAPVRKSDFGCPEASSETRIRRNQRVTGRAPLAEIRRAQKRKRLGSSQRAMSPRASCGPVPIAKDPSSPRHTNGSRNIRHRPAESEEDPARWTTHRWAYDSQIPARISKLRTRGCMAEPRAIVRYRCAASSCADAHE